MGCQFGELSLVDKRAKLRGTTKQEAVRMAAQAKPERLEEKVPLRERLARLHAEHPLPPPTGLEADKAFYDWLSGEE